MPCYYPITAYRSLTLKTENGKDVITFDRKVAASGPWEKFTVPCSGCIGCRVGRSKQWALRCVHEASLFTHNCFVTLTFNDASISPSGTLVKKDFVNFMKRLRKSFKGCECVKSIRSGEPTFPVRFFHCGEYGSELARPHHHVCLFNFDFADKVLWSKRGGISLYRSKDLESLWKVDGRSLGYSTVGELTFESAAYVARYITKKVNGQMADEHYRRVDEETGEVVQLVPEYITMSLRPGLAGRWFEKYSGDVYPKDFCTLSGRKFKTPRFYDNIYESVEPCKMAAVKRKRRLAAAKGASDNTMARLKARETVAKQKMSTLVREYESDDS